MEPAIGRSGDGGVLTEKLHVAVGAVARWAFGGLVQPTRRDEREFLPAALEVIETPPSPTGRMLGLIIILFFTAAARGALGTGYGRHGGSQNRHEDDHRLSALAPGAENAGESSREISWPVRSPSIGVILVREGKSRWRNCRKDERSLGASQPAGVPVHP